MLATIVISNYEKFVTYMNISHNFKFIETKEKTNTNYFTISKVKDN